jgi:signal transduction histidine kinase
MKLFTKYYRVNLITTVVVMIFTGIVYYEAISVILKNQVDTDLAEEEQEVFDYVKANHALPEETRSNEMEITFAPTAGSIKRSFINANFYNPREKENEMGRGLVSSVKVKGTNYRILVVESAEETEDLIKIIFGITIAVILILLAVLFIVNRMVLGHIWQPFYVILDQLKSFNVSKKNNITAQDSGVVEFRELNSAVISMAATVKREYNELKAFTENASHELLTPIAIINSKLDTLVQTDGFNAHQSALLNDLYTSVSRLTRLNQAMLLLSRIENHLIADTETVDLKELITERLAELQELYADKSISLTVSLQNKTIKANRYLIEVLINNLLVNAIRHNITQGRIEIGLTADEMAIKNTGVETDLSGKDIFKRFSKSAGSEGSGLGLTISGQICENYGFNLAYGYQGDMHCFTVKF